MIDMTHCLTIRQGTQISDEIDLGNRKLVGIFLPATLDGEVVSLLTRTGDPSFDSVPVCHITGTPYEITASPSRYVILNEDCIRFIRVGTPTQQTTDTKFTLALR